MVHPSRSSGFVPHRPPGGRLPVARVLPLLLVALFMAAPLEALDDGGVDGRVRDADGRPLRAVTVVALAPGEEEPLRTVETDATGYYRIQPLPEGTIRLRFIRLGHDAVEVEVEVPDEGRVRLDVEMARGAIGLEALEVTGERSRTRVRFEDDAGITSREISGDQIRLLPGLAESDPVRAVEILPGVVAPTDFSAAFHVRGGSSDQNLIVLDGFPLFNPFHMGGIFSVFNSDLVDRVELASGGFPAQFGGRVSSVLQVESDPGPGEFQLDGGVSLLAARMALSGGVPEGVEDRLGLESARWRLAARRSWIDQVARPFTEVPYHITDLQGVFEAWDRKGNRWTLTAYTGEDVMDLGRVEQEDFPLRITVDWGNDVLGARWLRALEGGGSLEARAGLTRFSTSLGFVDFDDTRFTSGIDQWTLAFQGDRPVGGGWTLGAGIQADRYDWANFAETGGTVFADDAGAGWSSAVFGQVKWARPGSWLLEAGVRVEGWSPEVGPGIVEPTPRLAVKRFFLGGDAALKASMGRYTQVLHSVRDEELPLGIDVWLTAGEDVPHVVSDQVQVGVETFPRPGWFVALDGYYRDFTGVITNNLASDPNISGDTFLAGTGRAWGSDLFVERSGEGVTGSLSVSWLRAERTFPDFASGQPGRPPITFPPINDRRLDVDLVLRAPLPRGWEGGLRWHVGSPIPYTRPLTGFPLFGPRQTRLGRLRWEGAAVDEDGAADPEAGAGETGVILGPRNAARYPWYHRMDVSVRKTYQREWGQITPYLDILNVYNQGNVLFYFYDYQTDPATRTGLSMFPVLPTVGFEVRLR
ncbi:MAG: hypothetical protein EA352_02480 [Gemmatimonadales bacterium]|nr:MAG: hypothetical protein EA352_02480 [Gemmatimonadales bacterium]